MAEVSATHDWLHNRLGHLDSVEFAGDRDLVETPKTSRRSSVIQEERSEESFLGNVQKDESRRTRSILDSLSYQINLICIAR